MPGDDDRHDSPLERMPSAAPRGVSAAEHGLAERIDSSHRARRRHPNRRHGGRHGTARLAAVAPARPGTCAALGGQVTEACIAQRRGRPPLSYGAGDIGLAESAAGRKEEVEKCRPACPRRLHASGPEATAPAGESDRPRTAALRLFRGSSASDRPRPPWRVKRSCSSTATSPGSPIPRIRDRCSSASQGLTFVVDAFTRHRGVICGMRPRQGGLAVVLGTYYGYRLISFFDATSPVIALASAMFALSWLERHNELTAPAGGGGHRLADRPADDRSSPRVVSLVAATNREVVTAADSPFTSPGTRRTSSGDAEHSHSRPATTIAPRSFRGRTARMEDQRITVAQPAPAADPGRIRPAARCRGNALAAGRRTQPAGYLLTGVREPADIDRLTAADAATPPVIITRAAAPWLQPNQCLVVSDVTFEQMIGSANWSQYSSTPDLVRAAANVSLGAGPDIPLRVHARCVAPLLDMSLALSASPRGRPHATRHFRRRRVVRRHDGRFSS